MTPVLNTDGFVQLLIGLVTPQMLLLTNFSLLDLLICQAVVSLLVTPCVPTVNHLYISILHADSCSENLPGILAGEHKNNG